MSLPVKFFLFILSIFLPVVMQAQTAPASMSNIQPEGGERGRTIKLTIDGINLAGTDHIFFSHAGLIGKIVTVEDLGTEKRVIPKGSLSAPIKDIANSFRVVVEVRIAPETPPGRYTFRLGTALGTTNSMAFAVTTLPEVAQTDSHPDLAHAQTLALPATITGQIKNIGAQDYYRFKVRAGQELVFDVNAASLGSSIDSLLELLDERGQVLASNDDYQDRSDSLLAYRVAASGDYFLRISDTMNSKGKRKFYRINAGELSYLSSVFPLGLERGRTGEVSVKGFNLGTPKAKIKVDAAKPSDTLDRLWVTLPKSYTEAFNRLRIATGAYPEIYSTEKNQNLESAQSIAWPVTINGHISKGQTNSYFKITAKRGEKLALNVNAQRLGSPLDSEIEVLTATGAQIPRIIVRPLMETFTTLRDHDSMTKGIRLLSPKGIDPGDFLLIDNELIKVERLPENPDMDTTMTSYKGQRFSYEGTTPEMHALDSPVYKVAIYDPQADIPTSGMKPRVFTYRNDDGGPAFGKDSYLMFTAPDDGEYLVRIKDARDLGGENYAYRFTIAPPAPDYSLTVTPANPNVPLGGSIPLQVFANRVDGFDEPIDVHVEGLPAGITATNGVILAGYYSTVLTLSCAPNFTAKDGTTSGFKWSVVGRSSSSHLHGKEIARLADPEDGVSLVSVAKPPDLMLTTEQHELTLEPGGEAEVTVKVNRANEFASRVPVEVMNLPFGINVPDVGLNGVLIRENESSRTFKIVADPKAQPVEQQIIIAARVETNSSVPSIHTAAPIRLRVVAKRTLATSSVRN